MTRQEIEEIIRSNIRTNGRGEITARVMAGVLDSFVTYTEGQADAFAELCRQLAASFNALVEEMEGKFEDKSEALEAALEQFCSDLLNNHFIPWADGLAQSLSDKMDTAKDAALDAMTASTEAKDAALTAVEKSNEAKTAALDAKALAQSAADKADDARTAALGAKASADDAKTAADGAKASADGAKTAADGAKESADDAKDAINDAADGIAEALEIIREGNVRQEPFVVPDGMCFAGSSIEEFPEIFDFTHITQGCVRGEWNMTGIFENCMNLKKAPAIQGNIIYGERMFSRCESLTDISAVHATFDSFSTYAPLVFPEGCVTIDGNLIEEGEYANPGLCDIGISPDAPSVIKIIKARSLYLSGAVNMLSVDMSEAEEGNWLELSHSISSDLSGRPYAPSADLLEHCTEITVNSTSANSNVTIIFPAGVDASGWKRLWLSAYNGGSIEAVLNGQLTGLGARTDFTYLNFKVTTVSLQSLQNLILSMEPTNGVTKKLSVTSATANMMSSDTTEYTYNGNTYVGLMNLVTAKGWTVMTS